MKAGIKNVIQCHGSFATASCINCRVKVPGDEIKDDLLNKRVPLCKVCNTGKPKRRRSTKKKKTKQRSDGWESDSGGEQEYPKGIMKVFTGCSPRGCRCVNDDLSPISHSLARSFALRSMRHIIRTSQRWTCYLSWAPR